MTHTRYLVVLNPTAGQGAAGGRKAEIEAALGAKHLDYELRLTKAPMHAAEMAEAAAREGFDVVVATGGDGTMNEVINGLVRASAGGGKAAVMGALGVGRGNDFAYGAGLPHAFEDSVEVLASGESRPLDVGLVVGGDYPQRRYFGNGIGVGFDTMVGLEAARMKKVHGFMAYVLGAAKVFAAFPKAPMVKVEGEGISREQRSHQISIMNGKRMGGTFFMAPQASNHDGLFDLCMAEELSRGDMIGLIARYTKGSQAGHPKIKIGRSSRFSIAAPQGGLVVHADGETICVNGSSLEIECLGGRIDLIHGSPRAPAAGAEGASRGGS
jgi:diacylglycerol kinase (ATP)